MNCDLTLDAEALQSAFVSPDDPQAQKLLNSIVRYSASLRGTRPFWNGRRANLETYVRGIRSPDVFKTFSAADYHWDSLHRCYGDQVYHRWNNGTPAERINLSRQQLRDNPHIAAYHFHRRFLAMMECIIKPKFKVTDWWNRYEFQGRGSSHNHGFMWTKDGPFLAVDDLESRRAFAQFWGVYVSGILPVNVDRALEERTAMSLPPENDQNTLRQLDMLVNPLQRHICTPSYCLRLRKGAPPDSEPECRFWAPWVLQEEPTVDKNRNPAHWMFSPVRNDDHLNSYVRIITMAWKANTDFAPCTGSQAVINYLGKYCTKEEKKTTTYMELVKQLLPFINSDKPLLSLVSKTMNKLVGERDWSSQEVMHVLLNIPLQQGSRDVVTLDCRPNQDSQAIQFNEDGEVVLKGSSKLQKYLNRPEELEGLTFFVYLTRYDWKKCTERPKAKPRLINYFPRYDIEKTPEDYARVKMMLHHPFRGEVNNLLSTPTQEYMDWTSAYRHCCDAHGSTHLYFNTDGFGDPVEIVEQDDMWELFEDDEENDLFWAELAAQRPGRDGAELEDPEALGKRDIDRAFDWSQFIDEHQVFPTWLAEMKEAYPKALEVDYASQSMVDSLSLKQRQAYDLVVNQALQHARHKASMLTVPRPRQLLYHLDGRAGTGKSFTIHCISGQLQQQLPVNPVQRAAPTGVAAHGINGRTLHSLFRLPISTNKLVPLSPGTLRSLQATLKDCTTLIIDEKSMLSLSVLAFLDQRLRQIFPRVDMPFGGIDIGLWGDFFQLPPVKAKALYNDEALSNQYDILGQALYKLFDRTVELDLVMRQQGDDPEQQKFRDALEGLRHNDITQDHWRLLATRVQGNLSAAEIATFDNALRIYGKKKDVNAYNHEKMRDLGVPVKQIKAQHTGTGAAEADWEKGGNLHKTLPLCLGARVMLTENLWTERGLVNGALGTVKGFHWQEGADLEKDIPTILVAFDSYDGPLLEDFEGGIRAVPIAPSKREFAINNVACTRTQVPLTVAWAITVHKAQGITADKIVTNIAEKDHVVGLTYVAISRVKKLTALLFEEPFDYSRFRSAKASKTETMRLADYARRLPQHISIAVPGSD
jgi:ATP-dependent DNA helicase PIF1